MRSPGPKVLVGLGAGAGAAVLAAALVTSGMGAVSAPDGGATASTPPTAGGSPMVEPATPAGPATPNRIPGGTVVGVPTDLTLPAYAGPCVITEPAARITGAQVDCDRLVVEAVGVRITGSRLRVVDVDGEGYSVTIEDSTLDAGKYVGPAVGFGSVTVRRSLILGGQHSVLCGSHCLIESSVLTSQSLPDGEARHNNGFLSNGGSDVVLRDNTIECSPPDNSADGGCSADVSFYGDFAAVSRVSIEGNRFRSTSGAFCLRLGFDPSKTYGDRTGQMTVTGNVFDRGTSGRCGSVGPVTSAPPGTRWSENTWSDGGAVELTER